MKHFKAVIASVLVFIVYFSIQVFVGFAAPKKFIYDLDYSEHIQMMAHISSLLIVIILLKLLLASIKDRIVNQFNFRWFFLLFIISALTFIISDPIFRIENILGLPLPVDLPSHSSKNYILITNALLLAPVVEELFFRELLYRVTIKYQISWKLWLLLSSLAFGFLHIESTESIFSAMILGLVLGYIYLKQGILFSIITHILYNFYWLIFHLNQETYIIILRELAFGFTYFGVILLCLFILIFMIIKLPQSSSIIRKN